MDQPTAPARAPTQAEFHAAIDAGSGHWLAACLGITRDPALAEDCVQEALASAWAKRDQFRRGAVEYTYQLFNEWQRRDALEGLVALAEDAPRDEGEAEDEAPTPEDDCALEQFGGDLGEALEALSDLERVCFVLKHLEQWRLKEIAAHLDVGIGPVKQALFRALKK